MNDLEFPDDGDVQFRDGTTAVPQPQDPSAQAPRGLTSRVVHGSMLSFGGQGITMLATLVATPFVIRLLGVESYGILALVNVLLGYLALSDVGMATASTKFASVAHEKGDDAEEAATVWSALAVAAVPATVLAVALAAGAPFLAEHALRLPATVQGPAVLALRLTAVAFFARVIAAVLNTPAVVRLRMDLVVLVSTATAVGQILLIPVVLALGGDLTAAVAVIAVAGILSALLYGVIGVRLLPRLRRPHVSVPMMNRLLRFGAALLVSSIGSMLLMSAEKLFLPRYASVQALAFYSVAFTFAYLLTQLPVAMLQSLVPAFSRLQVSSDRTDLELLYRRALRAMLFWALPGAIFICAVARPFLTVWAGADFGRESTLPVYLLIGGVVCAVFAFVPFALLVTLGRTDLVAGCHLSVLLPYLAVSIALIHRFGAPGAAVAWSLQSFTIAALFFLFVRRTTGFAFAPLPENRRAYVVALLVLLPVAATLMLTTSTLARVAVTFVAVCAHFALILTHVLTADERSGFRRLLPFGSGS